MSAAETLAKLAASQLGNCEDPRGSNRGPRIEKYLRATNLDDDAFPWCAAFVSWCVQAVAIAPGTFAPGFKLPRIATAYGFIDWANRVGAGVRGSGNVTIRSGDIAVYNFSHIGIVANPPTLAGQTFHAVEGNTDPDGSREGWEVALRPRTRSQVRAFIQLPFLA